MPLNFLLFSLQKSHKALPKLQLAKTANLRNQALTDKNSQLNIENEVLQISTKLATPAALQIIQKNSNGVKESKIGSLQWREMQFDITQLGQYYLKLSKFRLTCKF